MSFIDEETLIQSSFFYKFEISCPQRHLDKMINVHCRFDEPYSPVGCTSAQEKEYYRNISADNDKQERESGAGVCGQPVKASGSTILLLMDAFAYRGEP